MTPTLTDRYRTALRERMAERRMTLSDASARLGIDHWTLRRFLAGHGCRSDTLDTIAAWLDARPPMRGSGLVRWAPA